LKLNLPDLKTFSYKSEKMSEAPADVKHARDVSLRLSLKRKLDLKIEALSPAHTQFSLLSPRQAVTTQHKG
jgi:hypothetical protein